jgi:hypothetical protein
MPRQVNGKLRSGSVSIVLAPDEEGDWTERTENKDSESALLQENERRFNQDHDTTFLVAPVFDLIGPLGIGPHADVILDGTFVAPPDTVPYATKFIYQLKKGTSGRPGTAHVPRFATGRIQTRMETGKGTHLIPSIWLTLLTQHVVHHRPASIGISPNNGSYTIYFGLLARPLGLLSC